MVDQAARLREEAYNSSQLIRTSKLSRNSDQDCRVLTVTSGKGGVGKTSLVLNLGLALRRIGFQVVVIDADLGLANIDVMLNQTPRYHLNDVISGRKTLREVIMKGPLDLKIIPGGSGLFDLANLDGARRGILLDQLIDLENEGDFILIDTAAGLSRNVVSFVGAADDFIVVTTPEPTALTDAYGMIKVVAERELKQHGYVVVNATRSLQQGQHTFASLTRVVEKFIPAMKLTYLGDIRFDSAVSSAVHDFSPFVISRPRSQAATAVNRIAWRLAANGEVEKKAEGGVSRFINRLRDII